MTNRVRLLATSANQSYPVALEIIFYIGFLIAFVVKSLTTSPKISVFVIDWQASRLLDLAPSKSDLTFHYDRDNLAGSHVDRKSVV